MDLVRRALGALPDAAWLRRQFTADADLVHDVQHGLRMLARSPSFALSAVFILARWASAARSRSWRCSTPCSSGRWPIRTPIASSRCGGATQRGRPSARTSRLQTSSTGASATLVLAHGRRDSVFDGLHRRHRAGSSVRRAGHGRLLRALGMPPLIGRGFSPEEHVRGGRRAAIITYGFWQSRFSGDPGMINRSISMDGEPWTIVGVLPKAFAPQLLPRPGRIGGVDAQNHPGAREANSGKRLVERRRAAGSLASASIRRRPRWIRFRRRLRESILARTPRAVPRWSRFANT